jgi:hypothetical protein
MKVPWENGRKGAMLKRIFGKKPDSLVFVPPNFYRFVKSAVAKSAPHEAVGPAKPLPQDE